MITLENLQNRLTVTVPEAGEALGIGRGAAYAAAKRGEIPTLAFANRLVVPVPKLLELLGLPPERTETGPATGPATATINAPSKDDSHADSAPDPSASSNLRRVSGL